MPTKSLATKQPTQAPSRQIAPPAAQRIQPRAQSGDDFGSIAFLQRTAGNRAVTALVNGSAATSIGLPTIQRDGPDPAAEQARVAALQASYQQSISTNNWRQAAKDLNGFNQADIETRLGQLSHDQLTLLDTAARHAMPGWSERLIGYITIHDGEANRVGFLTFQYDNSVVARDFDGACIFLNAFNENDILAMAARLTAHDRERMKSAADDKHVGGGRLSKLLQAASGKNVDADYSEQVGGTVYSARAEYKYRLTPDAITVDVGMNFDPDRGVTVPAASWFGMITAKWNKFSAVNADDPADHKRIDFNPFQGEGTDIDVSAGTGRANAGHYYVSDGRAANTIPHEFGHILGLQDEYERDTNDFRAVTGQNPTGSATPPTTAEPIAQALHAALFLPEAHLEWHRTAERRRMRAVDAACAANGITPRWQGGRSVLTADVSAAYHRLYGVELSHDFMKQVDSGADEFSDWREKVLGTFQQTSTSLMGDMSAHDHPVEPRHVRAFAGYVQQMLGRGHWSPTEDH